jgi:hypothetical protein
LSRSENKSVLCLVTQSHRSASTEESAIEGDGGTACGHMGK